jgi:hypothetical protein
VWLPGSGAFLGLVVYETSRTQSGRSWRLRPWNRQETRTDIKGCGNVPKRKKRKSDAAVLARLRKELAKPCLAKSVRENATKKQIASWNAG